MLKFFNKDTGEEMKNFIIVREDELNLESLMCSFVTPSERDQMDLFMVEDEDGEYYITHTYNTVFDQEGTWEMLILDTNIKDYISEVKKEYEFIILDSAIYESESFDMSKFD